jgi:hypothetical protein
MRYRPWTLNKRIVIIFSSISFNFILPFYVFSGEINALYDVVEITIENSTKYSNPFDFNEVNLIGLFISPSGKKIQFHGFFDGDGNGGLKGSFWKIRFMPDEVGEWKVLYSWTDGTLGGQKQINVVDTGLPGPLKIASDNSFYFENARGIPFHARLYDLHHLGPEIKNISWEKASKLYIDIIKEKLIPYGYNMAMVDSPSSTSFNRNWWFHDLFDLQVWHDYEKILKYCLKNKIYVFPFDGMVSQKDVNKLNDIFIQYFSARFGAYSNYMGYSPTWEWTEVLSLDDINSIMTKLDELIPFPILLSVHDHSSSKFEDWLGFSMRQKPSRTVFAGNNRLIGDHGGIEHPHDKKPIIGAEDIWETVSGKFGQPRDPEEVCRGAWGAMMAGVMPLYSEWNKWSESPGNMAGEAIIRIMYDFLYQETDYRKFVQLNYLVSKNLRQICSGVPGKEYLVYDEDGGIVNLDLSKTSSSDEFYILWFNPITGDRIIGDIIKGGKMINKKSPFKKDSVLFLKKIT